MYHKIDWTKLHNTHNNPNDALKILKEDYYIETELSDGSFVWAFEKWIKREKVNLDKVIDMVKLDIKDDSKDHGRSTSDKAKK